MNTKRRTRAKRKRRTFAQRLKHGQKATKRHIRIPGRTGQIGHRHMQSLLDGQKRRSGGAAVPVKENEQQ